MTWGLEKALSLVYQTRKKHRTIVLLGDGRTHCPTGETDPLRLILDTLGRLPADVRIMTFYAGSSGGEDWNIGRPLLEHLARASGGAFNLAW